MIRIGEQVVCLATEALWQRDVVGVHPGEELAPRLVDQLVQGRHQTPVGSAGYPNALIAFSIAVNNVERSIGGSTSSTRNWKSLRVSSRMLRWPVRVSWAV